MHAGVVIDDAKLFNTKLLEWERHNRCPAPKRRSKRINAPRAPESTDPGLGVTGPRQLNRSLAPEQV